MIKILYIVPTTCFLFLIGCSGKAIDRNVYIKEYVNVSHNIPLASYPNTPNYRYISFDIIDGNICLTRSNLKHLGDNLLDTKEYILNLKSIIEYYEENIKDSKG